MSANQEFRKRGRTAVFGIFSGKTELEAAVSRLKMHGFRNSDISVLMPSAGDQQKLVHEKSTKAPEGATTGSTSGLVLGGAFGWLVGAGALAIPGVGPFIAAGPILSALAGAGIGGALGGVTGALIGMGIPRYEAKRYENSVKDGGMLISIHVDDAEWEEKATDLLEICGAKEISSSLEEANDRFGENYTSLQGDRFQEPTPPLL